MTTQISKRELIEELHRLAGESGEPPTWAEMDRNGSYSPDTYKYRWGSWNGALRSAGYSVHRNTTFDQQDLLNEIQRLADEDGSPPSRRNMASHGDFSPSAYLNAFGTWNKAVRSAGYMPNEENDIDINDLLDEINRLSNKLGHTPTFQEMDKHGVYSTKPYRDNFHSWWSAVVKSGCKPHNRRPLSIEATNRLFDSIVACKNRHPSQSLIGSLLLFTGITCRLLSNFSKNWIKNPTDELIFSIPSEYTVSGEHWEFKVPKSWEDPITNEQRSTHLPGLISWYLSYNESLDLWPSSIRRLLFRLASHADLEEYREEFNHSQLGSVPRVKPEDLRVTHGIHLARNEAPMEYIERRLGLMHTNTDIDVEELYVWISER